MLHQDPVQTACTVLQAAVCQQRGPHFGSTSLVLSKHLLVLRCVVLWH
jgi:hypothetical protein